MSVDRFVQEPEPVEESPATDEYAEIEVTLRDNRFKQYIARGGHKHAGDTVEAVLVNYVGGYLAFYRTGHTVISATRIILDDADRIDG